MIHKVYGETFDLEPLKTLFLNNKKSYSHSRHISRDSCKSVKLRIVDLEDKQDLQEAVLSLHHAYMIMFDKFSISKIVENQQGKCFLQQYSPDKVQ